MVTERIKANRIDGWQPPADGIVAKVYLVPDSTADDTQILEFPGAGWDRNYLTASDDPVLAALWDNEADAIYDDL